MAQMSIYTKIRHHSEKDVTASIGKNNQVYITFRNGSHKKITKTDYIRCEGVNGRVMFLEGAPGHGYKLATNKAGHTPNMYIKFSGDANPKVFNIIARTLGEDGSVNFNLDELEFTNMTNRVEKTERADIVRSLEEQADINAALIKRIEALEATVAALTAARVQPTFDTSGGPDDKKQRLIDFINSL